MSRAGKRTAQLARVHEVRWLTQQLAEARAAKLARSARDHEARCREADHHFAAALAEWQGILAAARFDPLAAAIHAAGVSEQDRIRAQADDALAAVQHDLAAARTDYGRSQAGHRCSAELLRRARIRDGRRREERLLALRDDENAGRALRP